MRIIKEYYSEKRAGLYKLAEVSGDRIIFTQLPDGSYKYQRESSPFWRLNSEEAFIAKFGWPAVEIFASKRIVGFDKAVKVGPYHLMRKKKYDGYIYEVDATQLRAFPKKHYPEMQFAYTKYLESAVRDMDFFQLEGTKIDRIIEFNGHSIYDVSGVSAVIDAVFKMVEEAV